MWMVAVGAVILLANLWSNGAFDDDDDTPSRAPAPAVNFQPAVNRAVNVPLTPRLGDLDCADIGREVYVSGNDPNFLDADNDGIGCEGW
jgi:hypothetical protein